MADQSVNWKDYVDSLHSEINGEIAAARKSALTAVDSVRREQDILATRDAEAADRILQAVQAADLVMQRKFEAIQKQIDDLSVFKTDLAIQAVQVVSLRNEMKLIHDASEQAISKSEVMTEKRFQSVNAFREQLSDQAATFMPREVSESQIAEIRTALQVLTGRVDMAAGKTLGTTATISLIIGAITIISTIILAANGAIG